MAFYPVTLHRFITTGSLKIRAIPLFWANSLPSLPPLPSLHLGNLCCYLLTFTGWQDICISTYMRNTHRPDAYFGKIMRHSAYFYTYFGVMPRIYVIFLFILKTCHPAYTTITPNIWFLIEPILRTLCNPGTVLQLFIKLAQEMSAQ